MCGIAGSIAWKGAPGTGAGSFDISALAYRGPDAMCTVDSIQVDPQPQCIAWRLAHARLSIVDLAAAANQPMCSADKRYWIVFNGEIYNHRELRVELEGLGHVFRTDHSDTEVLLQAYIAWGRECLGRLNGMFAFVVVDNLRGRVFGARDRMGIKPFYYKQEQGVLTFASEPKAILKDPEVERSELANYFNFLQVAGSGTFYRSIRKLPAAHCFELDGSGDLLPIRYWHPLNATNRTRDLLDPRPCFDLLEEAVDLQLEADVEVGTYLSGGLDSSLITALASRSRRVNTFSIGFDDSIAGYSSELPYARMVAEHLNTNHHAIIITPAEYLAAQERVFRILDEPIANNACGPLLLLSEKARSEGVTVCLSGEGSDELFVGYRHWHDGYRMDRLLAAVPKFVLDLYLGAGAPLLKKRKPDWVTWMSRKAKGQYLMWGGNDAMSHELQDRVFNKDFLAEASDPYRTVESFMDLDEVQGADFLQRLSAFDLQFRLPEYLLARVDRMSMAASVEARVPYLDHRLVEQAMRIPVDQLVSRQGEKMALKRYATPMLPERIVHRSKDGFTIPLHEVLNTKEAMRNRDLILAMDDRLAMYSKAFRDDIATGRVTGMRLWPHFALANWWNIHTQGG
jgi:asparagine synthase (glutamine-hydrolysing)